MVKRIDAEITALQADFAGRMVWLRSNYLPDPLPEAVKDWMAKFEAGFDALRDMAEDQEATAEYLRTRNQEAVPDDIVARILDRENPVPRLARVSRPVSPVTGRAGRGQSLSAERHGNRQE